MVVIDVIKGASRKPGSFPVELRKALRLVADKNMTQLFLFSCEHESQFDTEFYKNGVDDLKFRQDYITEMEHKLGYWVKQLRGLNYQIEGQAAWAAPRDEEIARKADEIGADLVVKHARSHARSQYNHPSRDTWNLVSSCKKPLLIVSNSSWPQHPVVMAAIDPKDNDENSLVFNDDIISLAVTIRNHLKGTLHSLHAYEGKTRSFVDSKRLSDAHTKLYGRQIARYAFPQKTVHLVDDSAISAISKLNRKLQTNITALGTASKFGMEGIDIGDTLEKMLDYLTTDLLIIKPIIQEQEDWSNVEPIQMLTNERAI